MVRIIVIVLACLCLTGLFMAVGQVTRSAASRPVARPASAPAGSQPTTQPLAAGDQVRSLVVDGRTRTFLVHVPPKLDLTKPTPVVLNYHGAYASGKVQAAFSGMNKKADSAGFVVVYPNGVNTFWNAFKGAAGENRMVNDVKFTAMMLDDLEAAMNVDTRRVYATGMSNGAMMCHRLAAELSDRIAAVAPVSGTICIENPKPARPISVLYFHGTQDKLVPWEGPTSISQRLLNFTSVDHTISTWVKLDGCPQKPQTTELADTAKDGTTVTRKVYGPGKEGSEVVLYTIDGGGHTWPGGDIAMERMLGKTTKNISANDLIWEFFQKHPMKAAPASAPAK